MNEALTPADKKIDGLKAYVAPKGWEEITDAEKIERLREVIKSSQRTISDLSITIHALTNSFEKHRHDLQSGAIVMPYDRYSRGGSGMVCASETSSTKAYF